MLKGSPIEKLKERAGKSLKKRPEDRSYKEAKDLSNWLAVTERWEEMKGNDYAVGLVRSEQTRAKMRAAQRARRQREHPEILRQRKRRASSSDE